MSPFIHIQSGLHCLSHTARAAFWRNLASAFPDLFDFFVDTSPEKAHAQKQLLAGLNSFYLHHLHGKDRTKACAHCQAELDRNALRCYNCKRRVPQKLQSEEDEGVGALDLISS